MDFEAMKSGQMWLSKALNLGEGETPFPWQVELLRRFLDGREVRSLDIPTGLGKTAAMAIWLIARALGASVPRRLVYVVDRRAVVDQATEVALGLRGFVEETSDVRTALDLQGRSLPISTLRGSFVDNREWLEDPTVPAIIVGTVDMVGSRLLFGGYGVSTKMRPYHAGFLGADTLVMLDEAHLVPPFEKLLQAIADGGAALGARESEHRQIVPPFKLVSLSATGSNDAGAALDLGENPGAHPVVTRRLNAVKRLRVERVEKRAELAKRMASEAWALTDDGRKQVRCIVFCDRREDAQNVRNELVKLLASAVGKSAKARSQEAAARVELFVGGRRVRERTIASERLKSLGFIAGTRERPNAAVFVVATSAGEVGVDLDADCAVCDLVAWERMVQRLGRVNRRGDNPADVVVVDCTELVKVKKSAKAKKEESTAEDPAVDAAAPRRELLADLDWRDGTANVSPGALLALKVRAKTDPALAERIERASTPPPLRPALTRPLVDAWSMTSLKEHPGRPEIQPWLRGWIPDDPPETALLWRTHLPIRESGPAVRKEEINAFFEAAPPHASELLESETFRVVAWLLKRVDALTSSSGEAPAATPQPMEPPLDTEESDDEESDDEEDVPEAPTSLPQSGAQSSGRGEVLGFVLTHANELTETLTVESLRPRRGEDAPKHKKRLQALLNGKTLVLRASFAGLAEGLLAPDVSVAPATADGPGVWMEPPSSSMDPVIRFRLRHTEAGTGLPRDRNWRGRYRFGSEISAEDEATRWILVEKWHHDAQTEEDRSASHPQLLDEHQSWTRDQADRIATSLGLSRSYRELLCIAARLHDEGKRASTWQRAFNAPTDGVYAKTFGPLNLSLLNGYRHEFGSLSYAAADASFKALSDDDKDLVLHLIAAHHGFARPLISTQGCSDAPSTLEPRRAEVALRFARLQRRWGPWGLAWWESLLRAADQRASKLNDDQDRLPSERA